MKSQDQATTFARLNPKRGSAPVLLYLRGDQPVLSGSHLDQGLLYLPDEIKCCKCHHCCLLWEHSEAVIVTEIFLQVFDAEGKDVTPRPLSHSEPSAAARRQSKLVPFSSYLGPVGLDFLSSFSTHQAPGAKTSSGSFSG